jgi:hypothetical protein
MYFSALYLFVPCNVTFWTWLNFTHKPLYNTHVKSHAWICLNFNPIWCVKDFPMHIFVCKQLPLGECVDKVVMVVTSLVHQVLWYKGMQMSCKALTLHITSSSCTFGSFGACHSPLSILSNYIIYQYSRTIAMACIG